MNSASGPIQDLRKDGNLERMAVTSTGLRIGESGTRWYSD